MFAHTGDDVCVVVLSRELMVSIHVDGVHAGRYTKTSSYEEVISRLLLRGDRVIVIRS